MPKELQALKVEEVSGVDAPANRRPFLLAKGATKTEDGQEFPASAYAYVPDAKESSTWKLRLIEAPGAAPTTAQIGRAIAALGKGFRGNKVEIPSADLGKVKAKVLSAWRKAHPDSKPEDVPAVLKSAGIMEQFGTVEDLFAAMHKALGGLFGAPVIPTLQEAIDDEQQDDQVDTMCCALSDAIDQVLDSDTTDKRTAVIGLMEQFIQRLDDWGMMKAGRKYSAANLDTLRSMKTVLDKMIADGEAPPNPKKPKEDDTMAGDAKKDELGGGVGAVEMDADGKPKKTKKEDGDDAMAKADTEIASLKKSNSDMAETIAKMQADFAKEQGLRLDAEFMTKAREIGPVPGASFEETAAMLKATAAVSPEALANYEKMARASAAILKNSATFGEVGSGGGGGAPAGASGLITKAQEIAKRDGIGIGDAMVKASKESPEAYNTYMAEQRKR